MGVGVGVEYSASVPSLGVSPSYDVNVFSSPEVCESHCTRVAQNFISRSSSSPGNWWMG